MASSAMKVLARAFVRDDGRFLAGLILGGSFGSLAVGTGVFLYQHQDTKLARLDAEYRLKRSLDRKAWEEESRASLQREIDMMKFALERASESSEVLNRVLMEKFRELSHQMETLTELADRWSKLVESVENEKKK